LKQPVIFNIYLKKKVLRYSGPTDEYSTFCGKEFSTLISLPRNPETHENHDIWNEKNVTDDGTIDNKLLASPRGVGTIWQAQ
jgi:hypothetical protein